MVEKINTGGVKIFVHSNETPKISEELKKDIKEAYGKYYERREKEERNKRILWYLVGAIILTGLLFLGFRLLF